MNYNGAEGLEFGGGSNKIDPSVLAGMLRTPPRTKFKANNYQELPAGCRVLFTECHGVSFWANIGRIDTELANGAPKAFFIKVVSNEIGKNMVHGEFESMKAIHAVSPDFVPKPIAWGTYKTIPDTHFFLCEFREMMEDMPDPHKFTARLADLH
jgi:protein-ribulosamine 3-kinase